MRALHDLVRRLAVAVVAICATEGMLFAQAPAPSPRPVDVDGRSMRVWTAGLEVRKRGEPVVVLEAGAGDGLETWQPVLAELARVAPVVAYDRRGIGGSAPDTMRPALRRVAQSLHALLGTLKIAPPYILVGQSWGGLFVRAFADQYSSEVAGLVFLDVSDFETTREEKAAAVPLEDKAEMLAPPVLPPIPADTPPGLRAEYEVVGSEMVNDYPEARSLRAPSGVPVAVVVATPPGRLEGAGGALVRLQMKHQAEWALTSPKGIFIAAGDMGHMVHRDRPQLVVELVQHVLENLPAR